MENAKIPPTGEVVKNSVRGQIQVSIRKFAGWEGRFTPAQDSQSLILELLIHC